MVSRKALCRMIIFAALLFQVPRVAAFDWDPVTEAEKSMKSNPLDPGAGAVVLFKRGQINVIEKSSLFWTTRIQTYVRIKVFNDAGRDAGNVSIDASKLVRMSRIEGRTILPSGEIIPLDSSKVFRGKAYTEGKNFAILESSFTFPSVQPGAIIEYQIEENEDWFYPSPWIFDTQEIGTLQSSLKVTIGPRLAMAQFPLDTTTNKISVSQNQTVLGTQFDFSVKNLRPILSEPFSLPYRDLATMIIFTPSQLGFGVDVYPLITKWDDVGKEVTEELTNMEKIDKEPKNKAKELAEKLPDPRKKAEAIYKYIQQNITSSDLAGVYLGRTADEILSAKRGDPDEINALFVLILKEVKIDSDMVLVATRNWQTLVRGFPNRSQFSRIVTRLNFKDGAVFADPADAASPFGDVPWFDRGVQGLAVKGSKVQEAVIPAGTVDDNVSTGKTTMHIAKDWTTEGDSEIELKGAEAIEFRADLMQEAPEKLERRLTDIFAYGNSDAEVTQIAHPEFRDSSQPFVLKAHLREKLTNETGPGGLLLNPWMGDQYQQPRFTTNVRHSAVRFNNPEKRISTSVWQVAPEIKVEQLPKEVKIENDLGGFSRSCTQNDATVTCTRTFYLKKLLLTTNFEYLSAKKFFDEIAKDDQEVIVLREQ
jgi:Domain of Unknown Function with PDB structure (DUF3857)/Transglutaminase-like superfamily